MFRLYMMTALAISLAIGLTLTTNHARDLQAQATMWEDSYVEESIKRKQVESDLDYANIQYDDLLLEHSNLQTKLQKRKEYIKELEKELQVKKEEERKAEAVSRAIKEGKEMVVEATAYTAYCTGCIGVTYWNEIDLRANPDQKVIAVDPDVIPLGSKVWVEGYGTAIAADIGSAIQGKRIDVFIPTKKEAFRWGRKEVRIRVLH